MQAPETVRLRYVGIPNVKNIYRGGDAGLKESVYLDSEGERYPSEGNFSLAFASRALKKFGNEFEVVGDIDGSQRKALEAWVPEQKGIPVGQASKNIQIVNPDGSVQEFPPGTVINVYPPGVTSNIIDPRVKSTVIPEMPPKITEKKLEGMSKAKIKRWAKSHLDIDLDPEELSKPMMIEAVLKSLRGEEPRDTTEVAGSSPKISQEKLNAMSKPKIAKWAERNLGLELDPRSVGEGGMSKGDMVTAVLEALE